MEQDMSPGDWAAWVQAIMSVFAIVWAGWHANQQAVRSKKELIDGCKGIAAHAIDALQDLLERLNDPARGYALTQYYDKTELIRLGDAVAAVPFQQLGDQALVGGFLDLQTAVNHAKGLVKAYAEQSSDGGMLYDDVRFNTIGAASTACLSIFGKRRTIEFDAAVKGGVTFDNLS